MDGGMTIIVGTGAVLDFDHRGIIPASIIDVISPLFGTVKHRYCEADGFYIARG